MKINEFKIDFSQMDAQEIHAYFQVLKNQNIPFKYINKYQTWNYNKYVIKGENLLKIVDSLSQEYSVYITDKVQRKTQAIDKGTISKHGKK